MTDQEETDSDSGMTREELERKVEEHKKKKRKEAYVKMGTVDNPRD